MLTEARSTEARAANAAAIRVEAVGRAEATLAFHGNVIYESDEVLAEVGCLDCREVRPMRVDQGRIYLYYELVTGCCGEKIAEF